jgi:regulator of extracellular matrix RemA (YlzA/DUF370 family)
LDEYSNKIELVNLGFDNFFLLNQVIGFLDYNVPSVKRVVSQAKTDNPLGVIKIAPYGKKVLTAVWLIGNRFVLTSVPRKKFARRLGFYATSTEQESE